MNKKLIPAFLALTLISSSVAFASDSVSRVAYTGQKQLPTAQLSVTQNPAVFENFSGQEKLATLSQSEKQLQGAGWITVGKWVVKNGKRVWTAISGYLTAQEIWNFFHK